MHPLRHRPFIQQRMNADQDQNAGHADGFNAIHQPQLANAGGHRSQQRSQADSEGIGAADQCIATSRWKVAAVERNSQLDSRPVQTCRGAQQELTQHVSAEGVSLKQHQVGTDGKQCCGADRPGAAQPAIKQGATEQSNHRSHQRRDGETTTDLTGGESDGMEDQRCHEDDAAGANRGQQPETGDISQAWRKLVPPPQRIRGCCADASQDDAS